ncbi:MAG: pyridoxamine 5'-phosphate oxidase family protein [Rubrivivax sp.]|jgi:hypothetical protein|nr:pyridoxamine 5'-phosphate oxidase family protein [Rubrivivax sp.]
MAERERLDDLTVLGAAIWQELAAAVRQRDHPWRVATLATTSADGSADARSVVLRDLHAEERALVFYTDARSPKAQQITARPEGTLVLWSHALGWQLRLPVALEIETAGLKVSSRWARLRMTPGAQDYLSPLPPGTPVAHPVPERGTREFFAVVTARIRAVDWLELHAAGHRRARFDDDGARWLVP